MYGLAILGFIGLLELVGLIIFILVLVKIAKQRAWLHLVLSLLFCGIYSFIIGWVKHKQWQLTREMIVWTVCTVLSVGLALAAGNEAQQELAKLLGQEQPEMSQDLQMLAAKAKAARAKAMAKRKAAQKKKAVADPFKAAVALWQDGRYRNPQQAVNHMTAFVKKNPNNAAGYNNRGLAYLDLKKAPQALKDFDKAIALNPNYAEAYNNRGTIHFARQVYDKALADYEKVVQLAPKAAEGYLNRGLALQRLEEQEASCRDFHTACTLGDCEGIKWARARGLCGESPVKEQPEPGAAPKAPAKLPPAPPKLKAQS